MTDEEYCRLAAEIPGPGNSEAEGVYPADSSVNRYGKLQVKGVQLCDEDGNPVQLKGLFLRSLGGEAKFLNDDCFDTFVHDWKIDIIRIPFMSAQWYTDPPYINEPRYERLVDKAVALSEKYGIYCIIDWHVLGDRNPFRYAKEALEFFSRFSYKYGAKKHVIYEICNEPNGKYVTWDDVIKPYAGLLVPAIRTADPEALVIVGTSTWSQDVDIAAENPLTFPNVLYAFHFYSGSNRARLRDRIEAASYKIPLFCSEWGNSNCFARNGPYKKESARWLDMMDSRKIGWCHFSISDTPVEASIFKPDAKTDGTWTDADLTASGKYIIAVLRNQS